MDARTLMTPAPLVATPDTTVGEVARMMGERDFGAVPVVDDLTRMRPVGIVTDRDLTVRCLARGGRPEDRVEEHMSKGTLFHVAPDADVERVMRMMRRHQVRRLMVLDEGKLVGIIAQADLALKEGPLAPVQVEEVVERISAPALFAG
jgi:CBS domain-containing protein